MTHRCLASLAAFGLALVVGCGPASGGAPEETASASAPIQGGGDDANDAFAVGVCAGSPGQCTRYCSGTLIAPNLVATARHCIGDVAPGSVDCVNGKFGPPDPPSRIFVTTDASMFAATHWYQAESFVTPDGDALCGSDLALVILNESVPAAIATPATPNVIHAMTDASHVALAETAIGFGLDSPLDTASYGHRRIREDVAIACVPHYPQASFDCATDPQAPFVMRGTEYVAGDATCEGDSGSGAFEQQSFVAGAPLVLGALSRGGVSADGKTCQGAIYTRFDAYAPLIIDAGKTAAQKGGYPAPAWTNATPPAVDTSLAADAGRGPGPAPVAPTAGSQNAATTGAQGGGCALAPRDPSKPIPWIVALAIAAVTARRRRRR